MRLDLNAGVSSVISRVGTAVPAHGYAQSQLYEAMAQVLPLDDKQRKALKGLYKHSGIGTRYSVLPDFQPAYLKGDPVHEPVLYPGDGVSPFPLLSARMAIYRAQVLPLALQAIREGNLDVRNITHVIAVSCTGLAAPGLDLMLLQALDLPAHTHRTCVHYMGCYAAVHALKQADQICRAEPEAQVLVVCVELCTLHFQSDTSWDHLTSSLLFADGAAALVVRGEVAGKQAHADGAAGSEDGGLRLRHFYSEVALDGWQEMTWDPDEKGFLMRLGRGVPFMLQSRTRELVSRALNSASAVAQLSAQDIAHWAIHPGGRLILDLFARELALPDHALWASRQVLQDYGNMSSPTVLFVLKALLQEGLTGPLFLAAFGPGLTMETALCEPC